MRHVLRARVEAANALSEMVAYLQAAPKDVRVRASSHLAERFGGTLDPLPHQEVEERVEEPRGWRGAREVIEFLRSRGGEDRGVEGRCGGCVGGGGE